MAHLDDHCAHCRQLLGHEWRKVHLWLDKLYEKHGPLHRPYRHHAEGIEVVRKRWGDEAAWAAKIHIIVDCWGIPTSADYQSGRVNHLGFGPFANAEEANRLLGEVIRQRQLGQRP